MGRHQTLGRFLVDPDSEYPQGQQDQVSVWRWLGIILAGVVLVLGGAWLLGPLPG